jgi:SAM-dependent methyltransferase
VVIPLVQGPRILDVGCGFGRWGVLITTNYWETFDGHPIGRPDVVGCDGHLPNVEMAKQSGFYSKVHYLTFPALPFDVGSFDTVLMIDVTNI